ncbi:MAG: invasion associated locus B family protein [Pseudomonadota bacterium]
MSDTRRAERRAKRVQTWGVVAAGLLCSSLIAIAPSAAQDATELSPQERLQQIIESVDPAEAQALAERLPDLAWVKVCGVDQRANQQVCNIRARELQIEGVTVAALQIIEQEGGESRMAAILPNRLQIPEGVRGQVDEGGQITGGFRICYPQNCVVEFPVDDALVNSMKAGGEFTVTALNEAGRAVPFSFTLTGFTAAYDGEGIESALLIAAEQVMRERAVSQAQNPPPASSDLQEALEQRARELRERLQQE